MKKRLLFSAFWLACGLFSASGPVAADLQNTPVPLAMKDARMYLGMELWYETVSPPRVLDVDQWSSAAPGADLLLAHYYHLAKTNQPEQVAQLYSSVDGSRERFESALAESTDYFANYSALNSLAIQSQIAWGNYLMVNHALSGTAYTLQWRDTLLCEGSNCVLSNALAGDAAMAVVGMDLMTFAQAYLQSAYDPVAVQAAMDVLKAQGNTLSLQPDFVADQATASALLIHADLEQLDTRRFQPGVEYDPAPPAEIQLLLELMTGMQAADESSLEAALTPYWSSLDMEDTVYMLKADPARPAEQGLPKPLAAFDYIWPAFRERVANWQALFVLGIARMGDLVFVYVLPEHEPVEEVLPTGTVPDSSYVPDYVDSPQLFTFDVSAPDGPVLVADIDQPFVWLALRSPALLEALRDIYARDVYTAVVAP